MVVLNERFNAEAGGRRRSFTLIELLVVIAIIGMVAGLLLPALALSRDRALGAVCQSNLRSVGVATQMYGLDTGRFPPAWQSSQCRWMDLVKPYIDKKSSVYLCPVDPEKIPLTWDPESQTFPSETRATEKLHYQYRDGYRNR